MNSTHPAQQSPIDASTWNPLLEIITSESSGIFVVDKQLHVLFINEAAISFTSLPQDVCLDWSCSEIFHTSHCQSDLCGIARTFTQGVSCFGHCRRAGQKKNKSIKFYTTPLTSPDGQILGCVVHLLKTLADKTSEKRTITCEHERALELLSRERVENAELTLLNSQLCKVNHKIGAMNRERATIEVVMMVADRLRNSVVAIGGLVRHLLRDIPFTPELEKKAKVISNEVDKLESRITEIESLPQKCKGLLQSIDLRELLDRAIWPYSKIFNNCGCKLIIRKPDEPVFIRANETILQMAVTNVIKKITRTSSSGGKILFEIDLGENQAVLTITGDDNKSPEMGVCQQRHKDAGQQQEDIDMELLLVRHIVEGHGGQFEARHHLEAGEMVYALILPKYWQIH